MPNMQGVNNYWKQLSDEEIRAGIHRRRVGGLWDEIGQLQFDFICAQGLRRDHTILDIGCGAMRGGLHFIRYLNEGNYYGFDINESLLRAANHEIDIASLRNKNPVLILDDNFNFYKIGRPCTHAIAFSLFTHLHINIILRCLTRLHEYIGDGGVLFATFFVAPDDIHLSDIEQYNNVITHFDADPFHYSISIMQWMGERTGFKAEYLGDWGHPKNQKMCKFIPL